LKLPLVVSVPHAGQEIPDYLTERILLDGGELEAEGDRGAKGIFAGLEPLVEAYRSIEIARAILDVDRSEEDRSRDGVIKTHTRSDQLIWDGPIEDETVQRLIEAYYRPYHTDLSNFARRRNVVLGIDCHTRPDGPLVTLSNGKGTCSDDTMDSLAECFARAFGATPAISHPETGGYSIRRHATELQWVEIQISQIGPLSLEAKAKAMKIALELWSSRRKTRWK
jgi:N-formylglutamate deformylase